MPTKFTKTMSRVALAATLFSTMPVNTLSAAAYSSIPSIHLKDGAVKAKAKALSLSKLTLISTKSIKVGKQSFALSKAHAAFFQKNKAVLKNARIAFTYDANKTIVSLTYVELNTAGSKSKSSTKLERNRVFDGMNGSIAGKVRVNADYVTIQNVKVSDLLVSDQVKSLVRLANVQVKGRLIHGKYVSGSAKQAVVAPKLLLEKSSACSLELNRKGTIASLSAKSNITSVAVTANAALEVGTGITLANVKAQSNVNQLKLTGAVGTLTSQSKDLTVSGATSIEQVKTSATKATLQLNVSGHVTQVTSSGNDTSLAFGKTADVDKLVLEKSGRVTATRPLDVLEVKGGEITLDAPVHQLTTSGEAALKLAPSVTIGNLTANASLKVEGGKLIEQLVLGGKATELVLDTATAAMTLQTKEDVTVKGTAKVDKVTLDSSSDVKLELDRVAKIEETKDNKGKVDTGTTVVDEIKVDESKVVTPPVPPVVPPVTPPPVTPGNGGGGTTPPGNGGGSNPGNGGGTPALTFEQRLQAYLAGNSSDAFEISENATIDGLTLSRDKKFQVAPDATLTLRGNITTGNHRIYLSGTGTVDASDVVWDIPSTKIGMVYGTALQGMEQFAVARHTVTEDMDFENSMVLIHADKVIDDSDELADAIAHQKKTPVAENTAAEDDAEAVQEGDSTSEESAVEEVTSEEEVAPEEPVAAIPAEAPLADEVWLLRGGEYDLQPNENIRLDNQTGYYMPLIQDGLTIVGEEDTVLYGSIYSANGVHASQNLITVDANRVTLDGLTIMPKIEANKVIEIIGKDFTLKNSKITPNTKVGHIADPFDEEFAGSVYFSTGTKVASATIENTVIEKGRITTGGKSKGLTLNLTDVTIDYAGSSVEADGGSYPFRNTVGSIINTNGLTVTASSASAREMTELIAELPSGTRLELGAGQYKLNKQLAITKGITIEGAGAVFSPGTSFPKDGDDPSKQLVSINEVSAAVTLKGLTFRDAYGTGLQAYRSANVHLENVTSYNNEKAGLNVNGSTVTATNLHTYGNSWHGVNVDSGGGVSENSVFILTSGNLEEQIGVYADDILETKTSGAAEVHLAGDWIEEQYGNSAKYWSSVSANASKVTVQSGSETQEYNTIHDAVAAAKAGDTVIIPAGRHYLSRQLVVDKAITLKGEQNAELLPTVYFQAAGNPEKNLVSVNGVSGEGKTVRLEGLTISNSRRSGLQVYQSTDVILTEVTLKDNKGAGLIVNGSTVTATGLHTSNNSWYGVNVDQGLSVSTVSRFKLESGTFEENLAIHSDNGVHANKIIVELPAASSLYQVQNGAMTSFVQTLADGVYVQAKEANEKVLTAYETVNAAVAGANDGDTVWIKGIQSVLSQVRIDKELTLKGLGENATILRDYYFPKSGTHYDNNLVTIEAGNKAVKLEDLTVRNSWRNGINVYLSSNVTLENVTSRNNAAAGLIVNSSTVTANKLNTFKNGWYGINVDPGSASEVQGVASILRMTNSVLAERYQIVSDKYHLGNSGVTVDAGSFRLENGTGFTYWTNRIIVSGAN